MKKPAWKPEHLDGEMVFDRFIAFDATLDALQEVLGVFAPRWYSGLRLYDAASDQRPVDISRADALKYVVTTSAFERGQTYRERVVKYGTPPHERRVGSAELHGSNREFDVMISLDEAVVSRLGAATQLGNSIAVQIRRPTVEGRPGAEWLAELFEVLCARLSPAWGTAGEVAEYWAKAMSDGPSIRAVGRDFGRFLPGLFWTNFFGRAYHELIGYQRVLTAPARRVMTVDDGILLTLSADPGDWATGEYRAAEALVLEHLGREYFFAKQDPDRRTVAPVWN